jgi:hypothetical protein
MHRGVACAAALAAWVPAVRATWSIIIIDTRTREVAIGSATCLADFDLRNSTPVLLTGIGGATAQSSVDSSGNNRVFIRDRMIRGVAPADILAALPGFDSAHQSRQYGIADVTPTGLGRAATFSGANASQWKGGRTGQIGTLVYAVQGNILTGAPVVDAAVAAIENTPGDVAARLMASMEAARAMGGDGRCSCSPSAPTSCGSPPPSFVRSANIAYMLIARIGDRDASNGLYPTGGAPNALAVGDVNGDGRPDILTVQVNTAAFNVFLNSTPAGSPCGLYDPRVGATLALTRPRFIEAADFDGDGRSEAVVAPDGSGPPQILVLRLNPDGTIASTHTRAALSSTVGLAAGDMNGDGIPDVVQLSGGTTTQIRVYPGHADATLGDPLTHFAGVPGRTCSLPVIGDFDGDGAGDVAVVDQNGVVRVHLASGGEWTASLGTSINALARIDLDADGGHDLVVHRTSPRQLVMLRNTGSGLVSAGALTPGFTAAGMGVGDVNRDGRDDVLLGGSGQLGVYMGSASGPVFDRATLYQDSFFFYTPNVFRLADIDGDGYLDVAALHLSQVFLIENLGPDGPGRFTDRLGTAAGDYFLNLNIANVLPTDPDPVPRLREMFDQWRADLVGRPDAVRSSADLSRPCVPVGGSARLVIRLRDWNDGLVTAPIASVTVRHAAGSAGAGAVGAVTPIGQGLFEVELSGLREGDDVLRVVVDDSIRPVTLMPDVAVAVRVSADWDGDGAIDFNDLLAFLNDLAALNPRADLNRDGTVDFNDLLEFLNRFNAGC